MLEVYYCGEKLIKATTSDVEGHYYEVGEIDTISNKIKITKDWNCLVGDWFEFIIKGEYENE